MLHGLLPIMEISVDVFEVHEQGVDLGVAEYLNHIE